MFHWVELRAFSHATEDVDKVEAALRTVFPQGSVRLESLQGHFGNPLVVLAARTDTAADIKAMWQRLVEALGTDEVLADLDDRIDDDAVYHLRIDKQRAYLGRIEKATSDDVIVVRAKVAAFPKRRDVAERALRTFVGGL